MALNLQDQARFNQLVQDGIRYAQQLGDTLTESALNQLPNAAAATNAQLRQLQLTVSGLAQTFAAFAGDVSAARQSFAAIVDEIKGITGGVTQATLAFRKLESVSRQVQQNQAGIGDMSKKQLRGLKDRVEMGP
jgi:methyl-accepting chemotaxis protein